MEIKGQGAPSREPEWLSGGSQETRGLASGVFILPVQWPLISTWSSVSCSPLPWISFQWLFASFYFVVRAVFGEDNLSPIYRSLDLKKPPKADGDHKSPKGKFSLCFIP